MLSLFALALNEIVLGRSRGLVLERRYDYIFIRIRIRIKPNEPVKLSEMVASRSSNSPSVSGSALWQHVRAGHPDLWAEAKGLG